MWAELPLVCGRLGLESGHRIKSQSDLRLVCMFIRDTNGQGSSWAPWQKQLVTGPHTMGLEPSSQGTGLLQHVGRTPSADLPLACLLKAAFLHHGLYLGFITSYLDPKAPTKAFFCPWMAAKYLFLWGDMGWRNNKN